jgi:hypothetical protein
MKDLSCCLTPTSAILRYCNETVGVERVVGTSIDGCVDDDGLGSEKLRGRSRSRKTESRQATSAFEGKLSGSLFSNFLPGQFSLRKETPGRLCFNLREFSAFLISFQAQGHRRSARFDESVADEVYRVYIIFIWGPAVLDHQIRKLREMPRPLGKFFLH